MGKVSLRSYNQEIDSLIDRGQSEQAIAHCRHILRYYPKHIDTYRLLGKVYLESQRYGDAADVFQRVLSSVPQDYISHVGMSIIREDEGNLDAAIWHMERASEVQPANKAIQAELRRLHGRRDRVEPPRARLTRGALARMYYKGELYPQAIAELRAALAEDPQRPDLQLLLANSYYKAGLRVETAEVCSALLSKLPYCFEANFMLAEILLKNDRTQESKIYTRHANELDPYAAHVSPKAPTPAQVPEAAVSIERLEYSPSVTQLEAQTQPEWASSLGVEVEGIESGKEVIPEWLSDIQPGTSQTESTQEEKAKPVPPFAIPDQDDTATADSPEESETFQQDSVSIFNLDGDQENESSGETETPSEDLIPDWMKAAGWIAADEEMGIISSSEEIPTTEGETEAPTEPGIPRADLPDWLQTMAPPSDPTTGEEHQTKVTTSELGEAAALSWLEETPSTTADNLATWLDKEKPGITTSTEPTSAGVEIIPDWLEKLDEELSGERVPHPTPTSSTISGDVETSVQPSGEHTSQTVETIQSSEGKSESTIQELQESELSETEFTEEGTPSFKSIDVSSDIDEALPEEIGASEPIDELILESELEEQYSDTASHDELLSSAPDDQQVSADEKPSPSYTIETEGEKTEVLGDEDAQILETEKEIISNSTGKELPIQPDEVSDVEEIVEVELSQSTSDTPDKPKGIVESAVDSQSLDEMGSEELISPEATSFEALFPDEAIPHEDDRESLAWLEELSDTDETSESLTGEPDDLQDDSLDSAEEEIIIGDPEEPHPTQMKEATMPEEEKYVEEPEPTPLESPSAEGEQEIPDWLQEIEISGDEELTEDLEPAEIPDWLRELAPTSSIEQEEIIPETAETIAEFSSVSEEFTEDIHEEVDAEPDLDEVSPEYLPGIAAAGVAASTSSDSISEWLKSLDEGKAQGIESRMEEDAVDRVAPSWATATLTDQDSMLEKSDPEADDAVPPFILDESEGEEPVLEIDEAPVAADDTKPSIVTMSKLQPETTAEPLSQLDEPLEQLIAEPKAPVPDPDVEPVSLEAPLVGDSATDEIPEWLADLAEESEEDLEDQPAELMDEMPDWLRELAPEPEDVVSDAVGDIEPPTVETERDVSAEITEETEIPDWLQEIEPDEAGFLEDKKVEEAKAPADEERDIPEVELQIEATIETDTEEQAPEFSPDDEDAAFAWLESLAVKQGADEALLLTPDERRETPPDWVQESAVDDQESDLLPLEEETVETPEIAPVAVSEETEKLADLSPDDQAIEGEFKDDLELEVVSEDDAAAEMPIPSGEPLEPTEELSEALGDEIAEIELAETDEAITEMEEKADALAETAEEMPELPSWLEGVDDEIPTDSETSWQPPEAESIDELPVSVEIVKPTLLDINQASLAEIERLPGIGFVRAQALVNHRKEHGELNSLEELQDVEGFDIEVIEGIKDHVTITRAPVDELAEDVGDEGEVALLQARNALVQDDPSEALEKYNILIQAKQMLPDVINDLREALYRFPVDVNLWQALGDAYARSGQLNDALDAYTKAEELLR